MYQYIMYELTTTPKSQCLCARTLDKIHLHAIATPPGFEAARMIEKLATILEVSLFFLRLSESI